MSILLGGYKSRAGYSFGICSVSAISYGTDKCGNLLHKLNWWQSTDSQQDIDSHTMIMLQGRQHDHGFIGQWEWAKDEVVLILYCKTNKLS